MVLAVPASVKVRRRSGNKLLDNSPAVIQTSPAAYAKKPITHSLGVQRTIIATHLSDLQQGILQMWLWRA